MINHFKRELDIPIKTPKDLGNTILVMKKILAGNSVECMNIPEKETTLLSRASTLNAMMFQSDLGRANAVGMKGLRTTAELRGEMKDLIQGRIQQFESCKELCLEILTGLSKNSRISFMIAVEGFYSKVRSENIPPEKVVIFALAKGVLRSIIREGDVNKNQALRKALEVDPELNNYICIFTQELVGLDPVFLNREGTANSPQRYNRENIEQWLATHDTDPMTRAPRTLADIHSDPLAEQMIKNKVPLWLKSLEGDTPPPFQSIQVLTSKSFLLVVAAAFPLIKENYAAVLEDLQDSKKSMEQWESFAEETIDRFVSLVEGISMSEKQVPQPCYPHVEKFIRQAAENLKNGGLLGVVKAQLHSKVCTLIDFFQRVNSDTLPTSFKEKALEIGATAIGEGAFLPRAIELFAEYKFFKIDPVGYEKRLRENCPGFVIGSEELTQYLGVVEKIPLPEWIWEMANQPCPIYSRYYEPEKKVWQSHMVILIPEIVEGEPLTLERLGKLVKGGFPGRETGYRYIDQEIFNEHGRKPACKSHWVLIAKDLLPISRNNTIEKQKGMVKLLKGSYQVPKLLDLAVCIFMRYLVSDPKECLFGKRTIARCQEQFEGWRLEAGHTMGIGNFSPMGLDILWSYGDDSNIGIGAEIVLDAAT